MRYDLLGRQTHTIDALGGVSYMGYDATGNRTLAQDELGNATYFFFDGLSRTTRVMDATLKSTYMGYDSRSSMVERIDADGRGTYMAYDVARRLERQYHSVPASLIALGETVTAPTYFVYDQVSNVRIVDDRLAGIGVTYFDHDVMDRVVKKVTLAGAVYYDYDRSGMKVGFKDADLSKNYYVFDAAGRLEREWLDDARTAYFHHDLSGRITTKILPANKIISYYTYDFAGRVKQLENFAGSMGQVVTYFAYQRDANGEPTWIRNEDDQNTYHEYDALNRLTLDERKSSSATLYGFRYAYDAAGNRDRKVTIHESNSRTYYVYDTRNLLVKEGVEGAGTGIYYDFDSARRMSAMRPTGADVQSAYFAHDQRNRATGIAFTKTSSPDTTRSFGYTGGGERVFATDDTTTYWQHDDGKLVREGSTAGAMARRYRRSDPAEIAQAGPFKFYPATDEQGSVRKFVDNIEGGVVGESYTNIFGVKLAESNDVSGLAQVRTRWMGSSVNGLNTTNDDFYLTGSGIYLPGSGVTAGGDGGVAVAGGHAMLLPLWDPYLPLLGRCKLPADAKQGYAYKLVKPWPICEWDKGTKGECPPLPADLDPDCDYFLVMGWPSCTWMSSCDDEVDPYQAKTPAECLQDYEMCIDRGKRWCAEFWADPPPIYDSEKNCLWHKVRQCANWLDECLHPKGRKPYTPVGVPSFRPPKERKGGKYRREPEVTPLGGDDDDSERGRLSPERQRQFDRLTRHNRSLDRKRHRQDVGIKITDGVRFVAGAGAVATIAAMFWPVAVIGVPVAVLVEAQQ